MQFDEAARVATPAFRVRRTSAQRRRGIALCAESAHPLSSAFVIWPATDRTIPKATIHPSALGVVGTPADDRIRPQVRALRRRRYARLVASAAHRYDPDSHAVSRAMLPATWSYAGVIASSPRQSREARRSSAKGIVRVGPAAGRLIETERGWARALSAVTPTYVGIRSWRPRPRQPLTAIGRNPGRSSSRPRLCRRSLCPSGEAPCRRVRKSQIPCLAFRL